MYFIHFCIIICFSPNFLIQNSTEVSKWLKDVEALQASLSKFWQCDPSGKTMIRCLNFLYQEITDNSTPVSPAVWTILGLVEEDKIAEFVEGLLCDANMNNNYKVLLVKLKRYQ